MARLSKIPVLLLITLLAGLALAPAACRDRAAPVAPAVSAAPAAGDAYAAHLAALQKKIPPQGGFTVIVQKPFVVIGDAGSAEVRHSAEGTVQWATEKLKQDYFSKDPAEITDIWLFRDKDSYEKYVKELFDDTPTSPFGYYSAEHNALVMNIATGGGTLVHEMVHAFIRTNFPACPTWFNEGLASLYEQSSDRGGHIHGGTNWRLAGLQDAIRAGHLTSFKALTATTSDEFYHKDRGANYAQARYLCYYLQEHGLLVKFYHSFVAAQPSDPTGYATLLKVLDLKDDQTRQEFQKSWEQYVLGLRFP